MNGIVCGVVAVLATAHIAVTATAHATATRALCLALAGEGH